jgi:ankyrin repeat protein
MDFLEELTKQQTQFSYHCKNDELELAQALLETNPEYFCLDEEISYSAQHAKHNVTRWLLQIRDNRRRSDRSKERQKLFTNHCVNGQLELAQALFKTDTTWFGIDNAILSSIANGSRNITKWLLQVERERLQERQKQEQMRPLQEQFSNHCANNELELAKQLLEQHPSICARWYGDDALRKAFKNNHKEVAIWLLTCMDQKNYCYFEYEFTIACECGQLEIAQWILEKHPNIDIFGYDNEGFTWACVLGHKNVVEWLLTLNPNQYINGARHEHALIRASQHDDVCHALWILCFKPETHFTTEYYNNKEDLYKFILLFCFDRKGLCLFL